MNVKQLEDQLNEAMEIYKEEIHSMIFTKKRGEQLTSHDMEDMSRQAYYVMNSFKNSIISYLKESDR